MGVPQITIETITPEIARSYLELNNGNRTLREGVVDRYAKSMLNCEWKLTGDPIVFNGVALIQGQHRLQACVKANVPFTTAVMRGAEADAYDVMDSGLSRQAGDAITHYGIANGRLVAAAARMVIGLRGNFVADTSRLSLEARRPVIVAEVTTYRDLYERWAKPAMTCKPVNKTAMLAFVVHVSQVECDREFLEDFVEGVATGASMKVGDPRLALRSWAINVRPGVYAAHHLAAVIRAWNAWINGEELKIIKGWYSHTPFPRIAATYPT